MGPDVAEGRVGMRGGRAGDCVGLRALGSSFVKELALVLARVHFPKHVLSLYFYCLNQSNRTMHGICNKNKGESPYYEWMIVIILR